jgi:hypothetical protein
VSNCLQNQSTTTGESSDQIANVLFQRFSQLGSLQALTHLWVRAIVAPVAR